MRPLVPVLVALSLPGCTFDPGGTATRDLGIREWPATETSRDAEIYDRGPDLYQGDINIVPAPDASLPDGLVFPFSPANISVGYWGMGPGDLFIGSGITLTIDTSNPAAAVASLPVGVGLYNDPQALYVILVLHDLTIDAGGTLSVGGKLPLIIAANNKVSIEGTLDASAVGRMPGPGGGYGGSAGADAQGTCGGKHGVYNTLATDADTGGAGGSFGGKGGQGGAGPYAVDPAGCIPNCDQHCVTSCLTPLVGGRGGGGGAEFPVIGGGGGAGGAGGGALQISAAAEILVGVNGKVLANGGAGGGGSGAGGSGAGGGSGGGILLEADKLTIQGVVAANGGGGGGGGAAFAGGDSGDDGTGAASPAAGGDGAEDWFFGTCRGGKGGAGSSRGDGKQDGQAGGTGVGQRGEGGGGGGAGRICLRSTSGAYAGSGVISPQTTTGSLPYVLCDFLQCK